MASDPAGRVPWTVERIRRARRRVTDQDCSQCDTFHDTDGRKHWNWCDEVDAAFDRLQEVEAELRVRLGREQQERDNVREAGRALRDKLYAIRAEAIKRPPSRDFDIGWQLGRLIDDIETGFNVGASVFLRDIIERSAASPAKERR